MSRTLAVNCSLLWKDLPVSERLSAAEAAGFEAVEFWWPFTTATPTDAEVNAFIEAVAASGRDLVSLNLFAGDMAGGDRGIASWGGREHEFRASVEVAVEVAERLGTRRFNALYGNRRDEVEAATQDSVALQNLRWACERLAPIAGVVLIEPVSGADRYPLRVAADAIAVIDRVRGVGAENIGLLLDVYHLAVNGDNVSAVIAEANALIAHVQVADAPGRGYPGSGELPLIEWMHRVRTGGYDGHIAFEFSHPAGDPFAEFDRTPWREIE